MASSAHSKNSQITSRVPRTTHTQIHNPRKHTITYEHICFVYGYIQYVQTTLVDARGASKMRRRTEKRTKAQVLCWIAFERVVFFMIIQHMYVWMWYVDKVRAESANARIFLMMCSLLFYHMFSKSTYVHTCTHMHNATHTYRSRFAISIFRALFAALYSAISGCCWNLGSL